MQRRECPTEHNQISLNAEKREDMRYTSGNPPFILYNEVLGLSGRAIAQMLCGVLKFARAKF